MNKRTQRQIIITAAVLFILGACLPCGSMGCLHHARLEFGLPLPWLGLDVKYGKPRPTAESFAHGRIEKVEGVQIYWTVLPFSIAGTLVISAIFVGFGKCVTGAVHMLSNRGRNGTPNQTSQPIAGKPGSG